MPLLKPLRHASARALLTTAAYCILFLIIAISEVTAQGAQPASSVFLVENLKQGGFNLYVRHAATDWSQRDNISTYGDWVSCDPTKIRQLSEEGRRDARALGDALRSLNIRLGQVFASPYCRTMETAKLISGRGAEPTTDLMNLRSQTFVGGREVIIARARQRLSRAPAAGVNNLFVAHGNLGRATIGVSLGEGEVVIVLPRGKGQFDVIGTFKAATLKVLIRP